MYLFNAKIENPEKLEQMLIGREHIVNMLVEAQLQHTKGVMTPQYLVIGSRGSGKTHMLRVIYDRLSKNGFYMAEHEIAYMVEDETGVGSYFDLLHRIFAALKRWSNDSSKTRFIIDQVEHLKEMHPRDWTKTAEKILLSFLRDKTLLVLIENFDSIMRGMDKQGNVIELAKLRDFIQQYKQISFIATSQSLIHALSDDRNPLYGFFNVINMKRLTLEESFEFIKKIALTEQNEDLIKFLESSEGRGHLEAIHQFTKGNHRLLLVFFDFLKAEFRSNLSDVFLKSIDELKPYYESFIKNLAPQQQKIVQYLSLQRNPQKGADIVRNCFLDKSTISKQLSELQRLGFVNAVNEKGRDKFYEISEPLLRMCFEINEDRNGIIKLFVNFLGQLYSAEQLKEKYLHYNYLERFQPEPLRKQYQAEAKFYKMVKVQYLSSWSLNEDDETKLASCNEPEEARKIITEILHQSSSSEIYISILELFRQQKWEKLIDNILQVLSNDNDNAYLYYVLSYSYERTGFKDKAIETIKKAINLKPEFQEALGNLGNFYASDGEYEKAIEAYKNAINLKPEFYEVWNNLGNSYSNLGQYRKAIDAYLKAIEIKPEYEVVWYNLGYSYIYNGENEKANEAFKKAIEIKPDFGQSWNNLGVIYINGKQYDEAKIAIFNAIKYINSFKKEEWIIPYSNLLEATLKLKEFEDAIAVIGQMFSIPEKLEYISELDDSIQFLVKECSETEIKVILIKLMSLCIEHQKLKKLSSLLSSIVFHLLKDHTEIKPHRFEMLKETFNDLFKDREEFTYPLRYLDIGIRYFVKEEKEAIYELSQEERLLFEKFTTNIT